MRAFVSCVYPVKVKDVMAAPPRPWPGGAPLSSSFKFFLGGFFFWKSGKIICKNIFHTQH